MLTPITLDDKNKVKVNCKGCGKEIICRPCYIKKYCTRACYFKDRSGVPFEYR